MTALVKLDPAVRPDRYSATVWRAYRICDRGKTYALGNVEADSLTAAVDAAKTTFLHREHLVIRETGDGIDKLHVFAIKRKSQPTYIWAGHERQRVHTHYADPVCVIDAAALAQFAPGEEG